MSVPVSIDEYSLYLPQNSQDLREQGVPEETIKRVERLRELAAHWRSYPSSSVREIVEYCMHSHQVEKSQAYDDVHILKVIIGNLEAVTKEFARWRVNQMIEADIRKAARDGNWRAVASMQKNYILNNQTDKPDTPDMAFDKIVVQSFDPTDDPRHAGVKPMPNLRKVRDEYVKKFSREAVDADYEEITPTDDKP